MNKSCLFKTKTIHLVTKFKLGCMRNWNILQQRTTHILKQVDIIEMPNRNKVKKFTPQLNIKKFKINVFLKKSI